MPPETTTDTFVQDILRNRNNRLILERWDRLALPDAWLVAGCLFQTVWNLRSGAAPDAQIKDYDLFYFDGDDLSAGGQQAVQRHVDAVLGDIGIAVEAVNQARVHLWYPQVFGHAYPRLTCARDGLDRFLVLGTCVGVRPAGSGWAVYAPYGLELLYEGLLTPNPLVDRGGLFERKAASYQARWPWLRIAREAGQPVDGEGSAMA
ncbi:MAG: nucleotidyltransferase family protein [Pseudomonadota bacterium]